MTHRSHSNRSTILRSITTGIASAALASAFAFTLPSVARAEDPVVPAAQPQVDNAKVNFTGAVNANAVYVRSGPGENYYATLKLDKGATVTVVGIKFDWLKIVPPEGSFSYVAKAFIEKRGDGSVGRVAKPDLNVRAGSGLNAMKTTVQTKLDQEEDVQILGEQDEYFKIKPPASAFLYVHKQFVDPVKQVVAVPAAVVEAAKTAEPIDSRPMLPPVAAAVTTVKPDDATVKPADVSVTPPSTQPAVAVAPTTQPGAAEQALVTPATQPTEPTVEVQFDTVEADFLAATNKTIEEQPIDDLTKRYEALTAGDKLPVSMRRVAEMRLSTLKVRADARAQFLDAKKMQAEAAARQQALKAERTELAQRVKEQDVVVYSAVGTLRTSSLQQGSVMLYRLTDPNTGRTLVYVRSSDPAYASLLNQFVGVRGEVASDAGMNLRVISPTLLEAVDQAKVNNGVTASMLPPSLLPKAPTASISGN